MNLQQLTIWASLTVCFVHGSLSHLFAFDPAQQDDSLAVLRHFAASMETGARPARFSDGQFALREEETVTLIGGCEMEEIAEAGYFEAFLQQSFADMRPQLRSVAWPADTVYRQQRPMFFFTEEGDTREGSVPDGRERIAPGVMIVQFGKMESLDRERSIAEFLRSYETLVGELKKISPRIVLVSPSPFFETGPAADLAPERNARLAEISTAGKSVANKHSALFIDLREGMDLTDATLSRNGVHLSNKGQQMAAQLIANVLFEPDKNREVKSSLLTAIQKKNFLWNQYFRPTNWAFLYGDRQHVPSSRGHKETDRRWFIEELNQLPGRLAAADSDIWKEAGQ